MAKLDLAFQLSANADGVAAGVAKADRELSKVGASARATAAEFRQAAKITSELRTPSEKYADTVGKLDSMMRRGLLSQEVYRRAIAKADADLKSATSNMDGFAKKAGVLEQVINRTSAAIRGVGEAVGAIASAGSSVISLGEDFARASAEIFAATAAWRLFRSATEAFRTPEGIWGIATGLSRALIVIKLAEIGLKQLGIEADGAANFATKATLAFGAFKVGQFYGLDKKLAPFIASLTAALPAALARVGIPIAATTSAVSSLGIVGSFVGAQLAKTALLSIPAFGQMAAAVYVVGKSFLGARERAYEMATAITEGKVSLKQLNAQLGELQAQQVDNLAFAMEEATAAGERSEKAFAGLADVFVTPFIGAFAAITSGTAGFKDGISGVVEGITSILLPIAQVIAPVFTLIGTIVEGVLKLIGVIGEALGLVLKIGGAVVHTFLSPFIVGLTNVVETIRSGMNAAFDFIGERIDWASQKIKDFYAYMSKVPIIGRAFASGENVPAVAAGANQAAAGAQQSDQLDFELRMYTARLQNEEAINEARKKAERERLDAELKAFGDRRAMEQQIEDARKKAAADLAAEDQKEAESQRNAITKQTDQFFEASKAAQKFGANGAAAAAQYEGGLTKLNRQLEDGVINETTYNREADKLKEKFEDQVDEMKQIASLEEKIAGASEFKAENEKALNGPSSEALKANDIRSSEGMSQFLALATGREDPAIAEYRKQNEKLQQIVAELRALQQQPADILGGAAA